MTINELATSAFNNMCDAQEVKEQAWQKYLELDAAFDVAAQAYDDTQEQE